MGYKFLGGHLALDFVNTVGGRTHTSAAKYVVDRERLASADDLHAWAVEAGIATKRRAEASVLKRAIALREALYRIFRSRKASADDLEILNRELANARAHERIGAKLAIEWTDADAPDHILRVIARAAVELLTSDRLDRVRQCGGESCGWLFLDTSRNRSRQWCDMADCGNVAKVRRFRERQRAR